MGTDTKSTPGEGRYFRSIPTHQTRYMHPDDLMGARLVRRLVIREVAQATRYNFTQRKEEPCWVVYFQGRTKGLRLNATNYERAIGLGFGPNMAEWAGREVGLMVEEDERVRAADKRVLRIIAPAAAPAKTPPASGAGEEAPAS